MRENEREMRNRDGEKQWRQQIRVVRTGGGLCHGPHAWQAWPRQVGQEAGRCARPERSQHLENRWKKNDKSKSVQPWRRPMSRALRQQSPWTGCPRVCGVFASCSGLHPRRRVLRRPQRCCLASGCAPAPSRLPPGTVPCVCFLATPGSALSVLISPMFPCQNQAFRTQHLTMIRASPRWRV